MSAYAGIGSRETPQLMLNLIITLAKELAKRDYTLRTGGADGADFAFCLGAQADIIDCIGPGGDVEVYLPWKSFNGWDKRGIWPGRHDEPSPEAFEMAAEHHPAWGRLSHGARALHARNCHQVLGWELDDPVEFVACWTPDGATKETSSRTGGTGQAIRIAAAHDIPVRNLERREHYIWAKCLVNPFYKKAILNARN